MPEVFNFANPMQKMQKKAKPKVVSVSLGDGYSQDSPNGLNHNLKTFTPTFDVDVILGQQIDQFLDDQGSHTSFLWTPHRGVQGLYKCPDWTVDIHETHYLIKCTFVQTVN